MQGSRYPTGPATAGLRLGASINFGNLTCLGKRGTPAIDATANRRCRKGAAPPMAGRNAGAEAAVTAAAARHTGQAIVLGNLHAGSISMN
jgi:hypothetical protein